jgi:integrase
VKNRYCRLCWVQLSGGHAWEGTTAKAVAALGGSGVRVGHHQLFSGRMAPRTGAGPAAGPPRRPRRILAPEAAWVQLDLLTPPARPDRRPPASPSLIAAVRVADGLAEAHGWSGEVRRRVRQGLAIALAGHRQGQDVRWSQIMPPLQAGHLCAGHVAEVLRQMGVLHDDRRPASGAWLDRKPGGLTGGIRRDAGRWLRTLKDGGPRSRPRHIATVRSHLGKALPALPDWPARYAHLREVTREDIETHLRDLHGSQRHNALVALRSLFGFCLSAGVIFRNPARGIKAGRRPATTVLQPLDQHDIDDAVAAAVTPAPRLIVALAGVHAARSSAVCALRLSDADPPSRRLLLGGQPRPLDDLTAHLLRACQRRARNRQGRSFSNFLPAISRDALNRISAEVRSWRLHLRTGHTFKDLARRINPIVAGGCSITGRSTAPRCLRCCNVSTPRAPPKPSSPSATSPPDQEKRYPDPAITARRPVEPAATRHDTPASGMPEPGRYPP